MKFKISAILVLALAVNGSVIAQEDPFRVPEGNYPGYIAVETLRDGNCFFWALADQLGRAGSRETDANELRAAVVAHIKANQEFYRPMMETFGVDVGDLLRSIGSDGAWTGEPEIRAVANALGITIVIRQSNGLDTRYEPSVEVATSSPASVSGEINIGYNGINHFESLVPVSEEATRGGSAVLSAMTEVVRAEQSRNSADMEVAGLRLEAQQIKSTIDKQKDLGKRLDELKGELLLDPSVVSLSLKNLKGIYRGFVDASLAFDSLKGLMFERINRYNTLAGLHQRLVEMYNEFATLGRGFFGSRGARDISDLIAKIVNLHGVERQKVADCINGLKPYESDKKLGKKVEAVIRLLQHFNDLNEYGLYRKEVAACFDEFRSWWVNMDLLAMDSYEDIIEFLRQMRYGIFKEDSDVSKLAGEIAENLMKAGSRQEFCKNCCELAALQRITGALKSVIEKLRTINAEIKVQEQQDSRLIEAQEREKALQRMGDELLRGVNGVMGSDVSSCYTRAQQIHEAIPTIYGDLLEMIDSMLQDIEENLEHLRAMQRETTVEWAQSYLDRRDDMSAQGAEANRPKLLELRASKKIQAGRRTGRNKLLDIASVNAQTLEQEVAVWLAAVNEAIEANPGRESKDIWKEVIKQRKETLERALSGSAQTEDAIRRTKELLILVNSPQEALARRAWNMLRNDNSSDLTRVTRRMSMGGSRELVAWTSEGDVALRHCEPSLIGGGRLVVMENGQLNDRATVVMLQQDLETISEFFSRAREVNDLLLLADISGSRVIEGHSSIFEQMEGRQRAVNSFLAEHPINEMYGRLLLLMCQVELHNLVGTVEMFKELLGRAEAIYKAIAAFVSPQQLKSYGFDIMVKVLGPCGFKVTQERLREGLTSFIAWGEQLTKNEKISDIVELTKGYLAVQVILQIFERTQNHDFAAEQRGLYELRYRLAQLLKENSSDAQRMFTVIGDRNVGSLGWREGEAQEEQQPSEKRVRVLSPWIGSADGSRAPREDVPFRDEAPVVVMPERESSEVATPVEALVQSSMEMNSADVGHETVEHNANTTSTAQGVSEDGGVMPNALNVLGGEVAVEGSVDESDLDSWLY